MGQVNVTLTGDEARLLRALDRVIAKERDLGREGREAGRATAEGAESAGRSIEKLIGNLSAWAAGLEVVKKTIEEVNAAQDRAARRLESDADNLKKLAQLSGGDTARHQALRAEAAATSQAQGISLGAAAGQIFDLEKGGVGADTRAALSTKLSLAGIDPKTILAARQLQKAFGGSTSAEGLAGVLGAELSIKHAGGSAEFLEGAAHDAALAKQAGLSEGQFLSGLGRVTEAEGEKGSKEFRELLAKSAERHLSIDRLMGMSDNASLRLLGPGGFAALKALKNAGGLGNVDVTNTAQLDRIAGIAQSDADIAAVTAKQRADAENAATAEGVGRARLGRESEIARLEASRRAQFGDSLPAQGLNKLIDIGVNGASLVGALSPTQAEGMITNGPTGLIVARLTEIASWLRRSGSGVRPEGEPGKTDK